jgi:hypothetical protein
LPKAVVKDVQQADVLFVYDRLKTLTLLPELLPLFYYGTGITCIFVMGTGVSPLWLRKGSRGRL